MEQEYEVVRELGKGSFGKVYEVKDKNGNLYAKKQIHKKYFQRNPALIDYYHTEIQIMKSIKSDYVVKFIGEYQKEDHYEIIMELCEEGNLEDYIERHYKNKQIPHRTIVRWFGQMLLGMQALHQVNALHRDLKLQNIFVRKNGSLLIGDFGASKIADGGVAISSVGTNRYLAPQVQLQEPYTSKVDIWTLGIILYQLYHKLNFPYNPSKNSQSYISSIKKSPTFINTPQQARNIIKKMLVRGQDYRIEWLDIHTSNYLAELIESLLNDGQNTGSIKMVNDLIECRHFYQVHSEILKNINSTKMKAKILYTIYQKWIQHYNDPNSKTYRMLMFEFLLTKKIIQLYNLSEQIKKEAKEIKTNILTQIELLLIKSSHQDLYFTINTIRLKNKKCVLTKEKNTIFCEQYFLQTVKQIQNKFINSEWQEGENVFNSMIKYL